MPTGPRTILLLLLTLLLVGCQEITPPRVRQLPATTLSRQAARNFALNRIRLGDAALIAGYFDLAYQNYWTAYRKYDQDFTPSTDADTFALYHAIRVQVPENIISVAFQHSTVARIAMALELQRSYRLLGLHLEYFAKEEPNSQVADDYLVMAGEFYLMGGLPKYALTPLKIVISRDAQYLRAYYNLGRASEALGEKATAISYWRLLAMIGGRVDPSAKEYSEASAYVDYAQGRIKVLEPEVEGSRLAPSLGR